MNEIHYSKVESDRFQINTYRGILDDFAIRDLQKVILEKAVDLLILRLPSTEKSMQSKVKELGFDYLHADTLVYYTCVLEKRDIPPLRNDLQFERLTPAKAGIFEEIVPEIFKGYQNHYFSNQYLDKQAILEGYVEWAAKYCNEADQRISWLVKRNGDIIGFATCSYDSYKKECEGVLYGVMPAAAGGGIYSDIIRFTQNYFKQKGYAKMFVSTQVQNFAVQKVWSREGFYLSHALDTFHINAMLNHSINEKRIEEVVFNEHSAQEFGQFSGDWNPIHFDDASARKIGFEGRIAHGASLQAHISKIFGTKYPGEGTLFLSNNNLYLYPVYLNKPHRLIISTIQRKENKLYKILVKVVNPKDRTCLLSYNTLLKKEV